ncbi:MAG: hypothetical protein J3K34DRAFT_505521, partial [Monoraphidium minutum]
AAVLVQLAPDDAAPQGAGRRRRRWRRRAGRRAGRRRERGDRHPAAQRRPPQQRRRRRRRQRRRRRARRERQRAGGAGAGARRGAGAVHRAAGARGLGACKGVPAQPRAGQARAAAALARAGRFCTGRPLAMGGRGPQHWKRAAARAGPGRRCAAGQLGSGRPWAAAAQLVWCGALVTCRSHITARRLPNAPRAQTQSIAAAWGAHFGPHARTHAAVPCQRCCLWPASSFRRAQRAARRAHE